MEFFGNLGVTILTSEGVNFILNILVWNSRWSVTYTPSSENALQTLVNDIPRFQPQSMMVFSTDKQRL